MTELEKEMKASKARMDRVERILEKSAAESEAAFCKINETLDSIAKRQAESDKRLGGFTQTAGEMLEEEFVDALDESKCIGDIAVDKVHRNIGSLYEFDAACMNGTVVIVVEIKHKVRLSDVQKFAEERLPHFAADCPLAAGRRKVFGAVGGGSITKKAKEEAEKRGLYILRLRNRQLIVESDRGVRAV